MASKKDTNMTHVDLDMEIRMDMIELLNTQLADTFDFYSQVKQAHWNVKGMNFIAIHKLFDEIAEDVLKYVDTIAERATALGGVALGTARIAAKNSRLKEIEHGALQSPDAIRMVVECMGNLASSTRTAIDTADKAGDIATADLFTEIVRDLDKHIYFLDSHLN